MEERKREEQLGRNFGCEATGAGWNLGSCEGRRQVGIGERRLDPPKKTLGRIRLGPIDVSGRAIVGYSGSYKEQSPFDLSHIHNYLFPYKSCWHLSFSLRASASSHPSNSSTF